ncbi:uncharacterized protein PgNI_02137 [Pyricularia grisea]|uniref:Uncharacterized protein n=1 Tax=Pyricularia grisea TaxID=148305 RepID=A0A6P8BJD0_PYRGI|nr:uncharacterized protein PgNI_02137 [Pyricularia grisea]TLD16800.1 hypothetical protein PgNI_02137 [Pyricularia grisea]
MRLSSIIAATLLAQSTFASPVFSDDPHAPTTVAGNQVASDLRDPDKINFEITEKMCKRMCLKKHRWKWGKEQFCDAECKDPIKRQQMAL